MGDACTISRYTTLLRYLDIVFYVLSLNLLERKAEPSFLGTLYTAMDGNKSITLKPYNTIVWALYASSREQQFKYLNTNTNQ